MKFENVDFLELLISDVCEGNDNEGKYEYVNDEYGDDDLIEDWGEERNEGYKELFKYLSENGEIEFESKEVGSLIKFSIEDNLIRLEFDYFED